MHKRLLFLLLPALLVLGGFLYLRFYMQSTIRKDGSYTTEVLPASDTLKGEKVSSLDLRPLFIARLQQLLKHSSNGLYDLKVGDLEIDVLASTVSLQRVVMQPNTRVFDSLKKSGHIAGSIFTISFSKLLIEGINLDDAITSKTMDYKLVRIVDPVIEIDSYAAAKKDLDSTTFSQRFLQQMQKLAIKNVIVEGGTVITYKQGKKDMRLNDVQVRMTDILLDSATRTDQQRFLFAKSAAITIRNYKMKTKDGFYALNVGKVTLKAPQQQVVLQNLSFASPYSKKQFVQQHKFSQEMYRLLLPSVSINGVNWWKLLNKEEVVADELIINKGTLSVYFDRSKPSRSRIGNFPSQMLMKVPVKLNIATVKVRNLDLSYEEYNPVSQQSGTVYLDNLAIRISNLSNRSRNPVVVTGSALFMHQVPMQASLRFDMVRNKQGVFKAGISSNSAFQGTLLNSFSEPLGLIKFENGTLQKMQARIAGNQWQASGNVLLLYKDLKLNLLEKENGGLDKKDVTTFLANALVLKKDNPQTGKEPRREAATFKRVPEAGFFALVWKTMLTGALKTIGAPAKLASKSSNASGKK